MFRLAADGFRPGQTKPAEILKIGRFMLRLAAGDVDILYPQQEGATITPCLLRREQGRIGVAQMQVAGRRWSEACDGAGRRWRKG